MPFPVYFVGAGPGDPELITVKGKKLLEEADRIIYAGSLVPEELLKVSKPSAKLIDSSSLTLEETHAIIVEGYHNGELIVRLHSGDPSLYGATHEQMVLLDRDKIPYEVVPGISAVFAAAARLKRELTVPGISQTLILTRFAGRTPVPDDESLRSLAAHRTTLVIYLSVQHIERLTRELVESYPSDTPVVVAYRIGWPDETFLHGTIEDIGEKVKQAGINRQALILVGKVFGDRDETKRSLLYDGNFSHGFRKVRK
ncbi:MAG: precorrin-4 C(11)-methyltransferase [Syntrophobacterales bacterium]|nr:precorrin-4 C(11)-methyltransferase [Syntrophobacterales bacterium]